MLQPMQWSFGPFRLDAHNACLWRDSQRVTLRPKTFAVLSYLVTHADQLVSKDQLLEAVWSETVVSDGVLKSCMVEIRKALDESAKTPMYIRTEHRRGYRFVAAVSPVHCHDQASERAVPNPIALSSACPGCGHELVSPTPTEEAKAEPLPFSDAETLVAALCVVVAQMLTTPLPDTSAQSMPESISSLA